ncbi:Fungalysin metallopeptidase-domain-containing protein [Crassisporium funariophilum]|nr:Fungalysin metallopeptidase-domain-containing protein [Crassisporium funariophilum]
MVSFSRFLTSILLATAYASYVTAAPGLVTSKLGTHRVHNIGRGLSIEAFHPPSTFETFDTGIDHPQSKRAVFSLQDAAIAFTASHQSLDASANGIRFANAVANVAFNKDGKVVSFGSSFVKPKSIASSSPSISVESAISSAEKAFDGKYNNHPTTLEYVIKEDNTAALTHSIQIQNDKTGAWIVAFVDAHTGKPANVVDFVAKADYIALPIVKETPGEGFETIIDPQDPLASLNGWHFSEFSETGYTTSTSGNNVITYKTTLSSLPGIPSGPTQESSAGPNFEYKQDNTSDPTTATNIDAARVNTFYIVNSVHDLTYRYGFTEAAFNFQNDNFGKGGVGNDRVAVSVQDSAGTDNADFATPPDGQSGRMRMYLWDLTSTRRDGALENDIVVHENTHGVTNRMTGGGTGRCLQTTEAGGMGEGWSDAMADWTEKTSSAVPDYVMGQYVTNNTAGIRTHPYSTSATVNPLRYSTVKTLNEVHAIGEVWANILHNVYAALVTAHGWSATARTDPAGTEGNIVFLHLFLDALALQPCNPTLVNARDAWIQADVTRYTGANKCVLWTAFASRGLGLYAANYVDDPTLPDGC